jgi:flagellar motor switch protein FliN/FliY
VFGGHRSTGTVATVDTYLVPADLEAILKIEVPLIVQIASRTMTTREILNLAPGAIIELPKLADEPLEILVANKPIGVGAAVKVGENFGVQVTHVGDVRERIHAMGGRAEGRPKTVISEGEEEAAPQKLAEELVPETSPSAGEASDGS